MKKNCILPFSHVWDFFRLFLVNLSKKKITFLIFLSSYAFLLQKITVLFRKLCFNIFFQSLCNRRSEISRKNVLLLLR